jgi:hypothetical protein
MALIATPTLLWLASGTAVASGAAATAAAAIAATAALLRRRVTWFRRGTHARRLFALGVLVVAPSALLYPIIDGAADSERSLRLDALLGQAQTHPAELRSRLTEALAQIDRVHALPSLVADHARSGRARHRGGVRVVATRVSRRAPHVVDRVCRATVAW